MKCLLFGVALIIMFSIHVPAEGLSGILAKWTAVVAREEDRTSGSSAFVSIFQHLKDDMSIEVLRLAQHDILGTTAHVTPGYTEVAFRDLMHVMAQEFRDEFLNEARTAVDTPWLQHSLWLFSEALSRRTAKLLGDEAALDIARSGAASENYAIFSEAIRALVGNVAHKGLSRDLAIAAIVHRDHRQRQALKILADSVGISPTEIDSMGQDLYP